MVRESLTEQMMPRQHFQGRTGFAREIKGDMHSRENSAQKAGDMKKHGMFEALQILVTAIAQSLNKPLRSV